MALALVLLPHGVLLCSAGGGAELADFPTRDLMFGLTTTESYLDLSAQDLEFGFNETRRDRILRTYVRNAYLYHLNEIFATLKNEYTDWERPVQNPLSVRDATLEVLSDGQTTAPLLRVGYLHTARARGGARGGRTYFMHFKHQSGERDFPQVSGRPHFACLQSPRRRVPLPCRGNAISFKPASAAAQRDLLPEGKPASASWRTTALSRDVARAFQELPASPST